MTTAVRLGPRSVVSLVLASLVGVMAFAWPLLVQPGAGLAHGTDAPLVFALVLPLVIGIVVAQLSEGGLDSKALAMLGVLSALGAALRPLGAGTAGVETVFFLLVLGGRVFGPGFGFVQGALTLFASALLTGGVGPWLPFQMLGAAWVGLGAGLLPAARGKVEVALLAAWAWASSLLYGLALNLSFWPFTLGPSTQLSFVPGDPLLDNLHRFGLFTLATSLGWDVGRAITTTVLVVLVGPAVLAALRRAARRAAFDAPVGFDPPGSAQARDSRSEGAGRRPPQAAGSGRGGAHLPPEHRRG
ncbi:MAG TPA: ECF transporter S component [Mycobacteriales bacterium]|nr:ECF transporter S component [Mycobacteriales bacterium]